MFLKMEETSVKAALIPEKRQSKKTAKKAD